MNRASSKPLILTALLAASFVINLDTTLVNVAPPGPVQVPVVITAGRPQAAPAAAEQR